MRRVGIAAAFVAAQVVTLTVVLGPVAGQGWFHGFRNCFSNDQLSYSAIATNVANGHLELVEPFTRTGSLFYPSLWYQVLGLFSRVTEIPVYAAWQILGSLVVCVLIAFLGWIALHLSRRAWAPILPGCAFFLGTLATFTSDKWYTALGNHAVLWGAFGTFFTLNAEVIGLCLITAALALLLLRVTPTNRMNRSIALFIIAGALIGITGNVQTYSFFTGLTFAAAWAAITGLRHSRSKARILITIAVLFLALLSGNAISDLLGHIPIYAFVIVAAAPGALVVARRHRKATLAFLVPLAVLASPQLIRTATGLLTKDDFLTYRQASTQNLGVPITSGLIAALPVVLLIITCLIGLHGAKRTAMTSLLLAGAASWVMLCTNDRWGFSQEPYRFWLEGFIVNGLLAATLLPAAISTYRERSKRTPLFPVIAAITLVVALASALDVPGWWRFAHDQGILDTSSSRMTALADITKDREGRIAAAPCIDPRALKLVTNAPVAHYNAGLAWPTNPDSIKILLDPDRRNVADPIALRAAGAEFIVADSACTDQWVFAPQDRITQIQSEPYAGGEIRLLQILP
jgi:hypothetical protein